MNFYFSYYGRKKIGEYKLYRPHFPPNISTFVEPFCGSCATASYYWQENRNADVEYHMNDSDTSLINKINHLREPDNLLRLINEYNKKIEVIPSKEDYILEYKEHLKNPTISGSFYFSKCRGMRDGLYPSNRKISKVDPKRYDLMNKFFKDVKLTNEDFSKILEEYRDIEDAFLYLDPPYLDSFNSGYTQYNCGSDKEDQDGTIIDNTGIFIDIMKYIKTAKCKVMIIINSNAINRYLFDGFIKATYIKQYQMTKRKCEHLIITNY